MPQSTTLSFIDYVLNRRQSSSFRGAVGQGRTTASEFSAYPALAWSWSGEGQAYTRRPTLLVAAMMCDFPQIDHRPGVPYAAALRQAAHARAVSSGRSVEDEEHRVARSLVGLQHQSLEEAATIIRVGLADIARSLAHPGLDWNDLAWTLRRWEHPLQRTRESVQRRLLEDMYRATHDHLTTTESPESHTDPARSS